ncbi:class I SAM-dependent methyltransferase [Streptomyces sp. AC563]|uniref:class I SAM-dependent methyltransferase n=1 Tax=Streptomyces buecherae TaxID=2763006 RepID=UPI00164E1254|nr:class I SAM-dependent methyltransferase [Streptomyces buecherae]MBC3993945.1 class I SAM-dependent methyltransferase [Streptomyces buecherae]
MKFHSTLIASRSARRALRPVLDQLDQRIDRKLRSARRELTVLREELRRAHSTDLLLGRDGRLTDRQPSREEIVELAAQIAVVTGRDSAYKETVLAYRTLVELENRGVGRIAGSTRNILGKLAATPLLNPPNGEILEIGTLYGLFAGGMARQLLRTGLPYQLTIVDPLSPVQLQPGFEISSDPSGTPVTEAVVRANLAYAGVEDARLRLRKGFSEDPAVREELSDRQYGVLIIDGDHSFEGVANDLQWAEQVAAPGAVIVMDDYGDGRWAGVREATEKRLAGDTRLRMIGQVATSAFLRAT